MDEHVRSVDERLRAVEGYLKMVLGGAATLAVCCLAFLGFEYWHIPKQVDRAVNERIGEQTMARLEHANTIANQLISPGQVALSDTWAVITARKGSPGYEPTQPGEGPVPWIGSTGSIEAITRSSAGHYTVALKSTVDPKKDLIVATAVRGYTVRIGAGGDSISIIVSTDAHGKEPVDEIVYLLVFRNRQDTT